MKTMILLFGQNKGGITMGIFMFYMGVFSIGFGVLAAIASFIERFIW
jgi:hypothetical protein